MVEVGKRGRRRAVGRYPLPEFAVTAFGRTNEAARVLLREGRRQEHGISANRPLTAAERRDYETLVRVTDRVFDRERGLR